jgi:membrane protein
MNIIIFIIYMVLGLFSANQLRIGLVKNARQSGVDTAPLRSRKFHKLLVALTFLFTGLPYLAVRFIPGSQIFAVFVYAFGLFLQTSILVVSPSQPELGWAMIGYAAAAIISGYHAYLSAKFEFFSSILAAAAAGLFLVGIFHFLRQKTEEDDDEEEDEEEDFEEAADSAMLEAAKRVITPSNVFTVILIVACLVAGKFLLQQLGIM